MSEIQVRRHKEERVEFNNSGVGPLKVPGCGLPIDYTIPVEGDGYFRHGANDFAGDRLTAREVEMVGLMNAITDKRRWWRKVFDDEIVGKWRDEALGNSRRTRWGVDALMSERAFEWCVRELRDKAREYERTGLVAGLDTASRCIKADTNNCPAGPGWPLVGSTVKDELKRAVERLVRKGLESEGDKDWHPGSTQRVLNLVHPSLFPLVYDGSRVLATGRVGLRDCVESCGKGEVIPGVDETEEQSDLGVRIPGSDNIVSSTATASPDNPPSTTTQTSKRTMMNDKSDSVWSKRFQWLPCEVKFHPTEVDGDSIHVRIASYINNLHPIHHRDLYGIIERILPAAIRGWNEVLIRGDPGRTPLRITTFEADCHPKFPDWVTWKPLRDLDPAERSEYIQKVKNYLDQPDPTGPPGPITEFYRFVEDWEGRNDRSHTHNVYWKYNKICRVKHPEPGVAYSYEDWKRGILHNSGSESDRRRNEEDDEGGVEDEEMVDDEDGDKKEKKVEGKGDNQTDPWPHHKYYAVNLQNEFRRKGLQVIVKLAGIELTPERSTYDGGNWHVEGMRNEHIVATAIYYFDVHNVTQSRVSFRQEAFLDDMRLVYDQDTHWPLAQVFGVDATELRDVPAVQELGSVATPEGRLLIFPNTLQHRVEPFGLQDPTKPGHRRFLVLWLVDPHYRVLSTANVPPQQPTWWAEKALRALEPHLPSELVRVVADMVSDWPMSLKKAKNLRLELMAERTTFKEEVESRIDMYNFCEH